MQARPVPEARAQVREEVAGVGQEDRTEVLERPAWAEVGAQELQAPRQRVFLDSRSLVLVWAANKGCKRVNRMDLGTSRVIVVSLGQGARAVALVRVAPQEVEALQGRAGKLDWAVAAQEA